MEWAYIPHFYYNYYVYQYATSFTSSQALAENIYHGSKSDRDRYIRFLSSGGSDYPVNQLKDAGVDKTQDLPFELTIHKIISVMEEREEILDELDASAS